MEVRCPKCAEETLSIACTTDKTISCTSCSEEFTVEELRTISSNLLKLAEWVATAPFAAET